MKLSKIHFAAVDSVNFWPRYHNKSVSILAMHAEKWAMIKKEGDWGDALSGVDVFIGDGVGLLLGYKFLTGKTITKCSGIDLIDSLTEQYSETPVFLWGARPEVVKNAADSYKKRGLKVVDYHDGYSGETADIINKISKSGAKLAMVGMSGKKQAEMVLRIHKELKISSMSVGGSFDVAGGGLKRAPKLIQTVGLEWLWRMMIDPKRLKRLPMLFLFVWYVMMEKIGLSK